jgi:hypothetical protein
MKAAPAPARPGRKAIVFRASPAAATQLRSAALIMKRSVQDVMSEALNDWFRKHGLPRLAGDRAPTHDLEVRIPRRRRRPSVAP